MLKNYFTIQKKGTTGATTSTTPTDPIQTHTQDSSSTGLGSKRDRNTETETKSHIKSTKLDDAAASSTWLAPASPQAKPSSDTQGSIKRVCLDEGDEGEVHLRRSSHKDTPSKSPARGASSTATPSSHARRRIIDDDDEDDDDYQRTETKQAPKHSKARSLDDDDDQIINPPELPKPTSPTKPKAKLTPASPAAKPKSAPTPDKSKSKPPSASDGAEPPKRKIPAFVFSGQRASPAMKGQKPPPPPGAPNCLAYGGGGHVARGKLGLGPQNTHPLTFVFSGTLDSLEREEAEDLVKKYGARVTSAVSGKTDYLITGVEPSANKIKAAEKNNVFVTDEDGLFDLIRSRSVGYQSAPKATPSTTAATSSSTSSSPAPISTATSTFDTMSAPALPTTKPDTSAKPSKFIPPPTHSGPPEVELWVDKHRPKTAAEIVGNQSSVNEVINYLKGWAHTFLGPKPSTTLPRAILLSGAPGIGKSTAAALCAKAVGFDVLEFNASDVRNKAGIQQEVGTILDNRALSEFFGRESDEKSGGKATAKRDPNKLVIIMDEVDGMSSSDRGGMAELISCIKDSKTPIICICNDASSPKVKSLKKYTLNITWKRPTAQQILPRMLRIAKAEGLNIEPQAMEKLISAVRGDLRQTINTLQMWSTSGGVIDFDTAKERIDANGKDFESTPFDITPRLFRPPQSADWIGERINDYFIAADMIPLFVQDAYLNARALAFPTRSGAEPEPMSTYAHAADLISEGDIISQSLRSEQNWGLMPVHGALSTVAPAAFCGGGLTQMINFPVILGKMSTMGKNTRNMAQVREILSLDTTLTNKSLALEYLPVLRTKLLKPLKEKPGEQGIDAVIQVMSEYGLTRDDWEVIMELSEDLAELKLDAVESSVKAAFTRKVKKEGIVLKVSRSAGTDKFKPTRERGAKTEEEEEEVEEKEVEDNEEEEEEGSEDFGKGKGKGKGKASDPMIQRVDAKPAKSTASKPRAPSKAKSGGGGRGKKVVQDSDDDDD